MLYAIHDLTKQSDLEVDVSGKRFKYLYHTPELNPEYRSRYKLEDMNNPDVRISHMFVHCRFCTVTLSEKALFGKREQIQVPAVAIHISDAFGKDTHIGTYLIVGNTGSGFDLRRYVFGKLERKYRTVDLGINEKLRSINGDPEFTQNLYVRKGATVTLPGDAIRIVMKVKSEVLK